MVHTLVVGGTKGLGRVVARTMAERGDTVSVIGRSIMPSSDLSSGAITSYQADINDLGSVTKALQDISKNNIGINYCVFLQRYRGNDDSWHGEIQTTLTATKNIVDLIMPLMASETDKAIAMVSSVFGQFVGEGQSISYHIAKAGLDQLMRYYAVNLGKEGIRCNGVTPFTFLKEESKSFYLENEQVKSLYEKIIPLKRMAATEDSANLIAFLCSEKASFISGQNILVDGGLSLVWPETMARQLMQV